MLPNIISDTERGVSIEQVLAHYGAKPSQTEGRYFCPFRRCAGDKYPHFVIDDKCVDEYGRRITGKVTRETIVLRHWRCEHSRVDGYGVVSLMAAILGYPADRAALTRKQLVHVLTELTLISGRPATELEEKNRNGWLMTNAPQPQWRIWLNDRISPEAMTALALDGMEGIPGAEIAETMHCKFGLWQVEKYIMAGCYPSGDRHTDDLFKSYERRAHALFPMFAFCYDWESGRPLTENPEKRTDRWVARIVLPAFVKQRGEDFDWKQDFWVVLNSEDQKTDLKEWESRVHVLADSVAYETILTHDALAAAADSGEQLRTTREVEDEEPVLNKRGEETGKTKTVIKTEELKPEEVRLQKCVLCRTPLDAVSVYLWLNFPRRKMPNSDYYSNNFWHVAWLRQSDYVINPFEHLALSTIATDTFELFGNDRTEIADANRNAIRYNYLRMCMLPTSMSEMDQVDGGVGRWHTPHSPIDFFRYYRMTPDDETRNMLIVGSTIGCKALMLQKELNGSSALKPFTRVEKNKRKAGQKNYSYEINLNAAWQMMANKGYCRSVERGTRNSIGKCYRIDGHFVYELDPASVMADMRRSLEDYAKDNANGDVEDVEMMMNAMLKCKDVQFEKNITKLPIMAMPKSESYGPDIDYFFFRNGALEITPRNIVFRSYRDLDFLVYDTQVLPFDYVQPFYGHVSPISIRQNPEYASRLKAYEEARRAGEKSDEELHEMKRKLKEYAVLNRWDINISPTDAEIDPRIDVPSSIRNGAGNEWLRWWPFLRFLRCLANEDWALEEAGQFSGLDQKTLTARLANLMFVCGRAVWRHHENCQYMPYLLENKVDKEGKAQGGSGKSLLAQHFLSFVRNVCQIDAKDMGKGDDFANVFAKFKRHFHDVVHIEDFPRMPLDPFYNIASGQFRYRPRYADPEEIPHSESPMVIFSSNFMVQSTDESALGRILFGGVSHYFSRDVEAYDKEGRRVTTIMPDFWTDPEKASPEFRGQVIYSLAKCVQLCMMATAMDVKIVSPGQDLLERLSRSELGDTFYDWMTRRFLVKDCIYNVPIAINEIFNSYKQYRDASNANKEKISRSYFYEQLQKYCAKPAHAVSFMPIRPFLSTTELNRGKTSATEGTEKSYLRKGMSWVTRNFIDPDGNLHTARVLTSNGNSGERITGGAVWFSRPGTQPKDEAELKAILERYANAPDPEPILDDNDQPIIASAHSDWTMLSTEDDAELIRKSGYRRPSISPSSSVGNTPTSTVGTSPADEHRQGEAIPDESLLF